MSMRRIPRSFLRQKASYSTLTRGTYGESWSNPIEVPCRFEPATRSHRTLQGELIFGTATMFVEPEIDLPIGTRVTYDGKDYVVIQSDTYVNYWGEYHHREVILQ